MSKLFIKNKYGITPNELLNNKKISSRAKGLFAYIQSKPDGWDFSTERIASQLKEGIKAVRSTLQELEKYGYLVRKLHRKENGDWRGYEYILYAEVPKGRPPQKGRTRMAMTPKGKDISNKDNSKKEIVKKSLRADAREESEIKNLLEDIQKHIQIIGLYGKAKQVIWDNKKQQQSFIKRNLRPARDLTGYDFKKIVDTMKYLIDNADFKWTLETVGKFIDEDLDKLKKLTKSEDDIIQDILKK